MSNASIEMTGDRELEKMLEAIVAEDGPKAMNSALRKATRAVCKDVILPATKDLIPSDSGDLEAALKVRAIKRSRGKVGHSVGFQDPLFQGDTFYGGFQEFGFTNRAGGHVESDSYLRRALYENEDEVDRYVENALAQWVKDRNRETPG